MTDQEQAEIDRKRLEEFLSRKLAELMEHFAVVRIFVQWENTAMGITSSRSTGGGNFYAQYGHILEWIQEMDEATRIAQRERQEEGE